MGRVDDDEFVQSLGVSDCKVPGDDPAPIVSNQRKPARTKMVSDASDVFDELLNLVRLDGRRLGGQVIAAHVDGDRLVVATELWKLLPPGVPELGHAMQEQHERTRASRDVMKPHTIHVGVPVRLDGWRYRLGL